ncbi:uncharacterized protein DS421_1g22050 [Arachis hypogaea]|nr:uncharacterized protein DS421_1g22050 [Arachis hypogaea]
MVLTKMYLEIERIIRGKYEIMERTQHNALHSQNVYVCLSKGPVLLNMSPNHP